jgi:hypothetical protein
MESIIIYDNIKVDNIININITNTIRKTFGLSILFEWKITVFVIFCAASWTYQFDVIFCIKSTTTRNSKGWFNHVHIFSQLCIRLLHNIGVFWMLKLLCSSYLKKWLSLCCPSSCRLNNSCWQMYHILSACTNVWNDATDTAWVVVPSSHCNAKLVFERRMKITSKAQRYQKLTSIAHALL